MPHQINLVTSLKMKTERSRSTAPATAIRQVAKVAGNYNPFKPGNYSFCGPGNDDKTQSKRGDIQDCDKEISRYSV